MLPAQSVGHLCPERKTLVKLVRVQNCGKVPKLAHKGDLSSWWQERYGAIFTASFSLPLSVLRLTDGLFFKENLLSGLQFPLGFPVPDYPFKLLCVELGQNRGQVGSR